MEEKATSARVSDTNNSYLNFSNGQGDPFDLDQYDMKD